MTRPDHRESVQAAPWAWTVALVLAGCGPTLPVGSETDPGPADSSEGTTTGPVATTDVATTTPPMEVDSSTSGPSMTTVASVTTEDSVGFIPHYDHEPGNECDLFAQDCPRGEKCMPWANDGGGYWNALRCSPIVDNPGQPGDDCTVEGSAVSGIDDCELGAMCWNVDAATNTGACVAMCVGSYEEPTCEDDAISCSLNSDGTIALCIPWCDPLLQDCSDGYGCNPVGGGFQCVPVSEDAGGYASECDYIGDCAPGLFCLEAEHVPDCAAPVGCCTEVCDISSALGDGQCMGVDGGQQCVPWYEEPPPQYPDVGVCSTVP